MWCLKLTQHVQAQSNATLKDAGLRPLAAILTRGSPRDHRLTALSAPAAATLTPTTLRRLFPGLLSRLLPPDMASTRAAAPLRSVLRIALSRPAPIAALGARPAIGSRYPVVLHARPFQTIGVRWEKSAAGGAHAEPRKWDFDMVRRDTGFFLGRSGCAYCLFGIGEGSIRNEAREPPPNRYFITPSRSALSRSRPGRISILASPAQTPS